jgi:hypothetical protein
MGKPLDELGTADAIPLNGGVLAGEVRWPRSLERPRGRLLRIEFRLRRAALFGFEFPA